MVIEAYPHRARVDSLSPNPWNPNVMSAEIFEKELNSIREFGFIDPITVMVDPDDPRRMVIIDGEHRWKAAQLLGLPDVPIMVLDGLTLLQAKKLTPILNGLRGEPDPAKLSLLLKDLLNEESTESLLRTMPFDIAQFNEIAGIAPFDWDAFSDQMNEGSNRSKESWVERTYRLPVGAAEVIDQAIQKAKTGPDDIADWQALELVCADFLAQG